MAVRELELDLDAFEGPFDLLLTLLLKEELEPAEIDMAAIVVAFVERLAEREELDLEACGEFLVLIAALLELKARALFPDEEAELAELEPEEAAEELARRLAEYRRMKEAAGWLAERLADERDRYFRVGPAPLAPRPERRLAEQDPEQLATVLRLLAEPAPEVSLAHMALRFPPVAQFLERFRAVLRTRRRFDFDAEVGVTLPRRASGCVSRAAGAPQGRGDRTRPGRAVRADKGFPPRRRKENGMDRPLRLITSNPVDQLARTLEALLVVASAPLSVDELAQAADDDAERIETALGLLSERFREGRSGIVLERVAGGYAFRAAREAADACARLFERPVERGLSQAALETLAIVAYLGPLLPAGDRPHPRRRRRLGRRGAARARPDRRGRTGRRRRRRRPLPHDAALRARLRAREHRRATAPRRPRRDGGGHPRAAPLGRRRQNRLTALAGCASWPAEPASGAVSRSSRRSSRRPVLRTVPPAYAPRAARQEPSGLQGRGQSRGQSPNGTARPASQKCHD